MTRFFGCAFLGCAFLFAHILSAPQRADASSWGISAIATRDGYPVFTVRGEPFFIWGGAFFYERIPRSRWSSELAALHALHVNTVDLYIPWNWHELSDGRFDFTGSSNPGRDLRALLQLIRSMGFYLIIRPGPVIRNEWRNGGYPAWLLRRPEYRMPLHDILEGRYPATATLQNTRSDAAAAEWMRNATHMRYAQRWLRRALAELAPVADRVIAVQLDDDQGAYLMNQTWPAPHLRSYLLRLAATVRAATSSRVPVFINTYQMKVTASSPVWTMGNWYQSDTRIIGEHDRAQLAFTTALLGTRPHQPIVLSEFQAGWLLAPEDIYPRRSAPSNTLLALHTALAEGARGVVDFPLQDTLAPAGWEAPFANRFYAWDAAFDLDGRPAPRFAPTAAFGELIARDGAALAATHPVADAAVPWWPSALDPRSLSNDDVAAIADATIEAQRACRIRQLACRLVDLRFAEDAELARYHALIVPRLPSALRAPTRIIPLVRTRLDAFARRDALVRSFDEPRGRRIVAQRAVRGLDGATLHVGVDRDGRRIVFLDVVNYGTLPLRGKVHVRFGSFVRDLEVRVRPRSAALLRLDQAAATRLTSLPLPPPRMQGVPLRRDVQAAAETIGSLVLENPLARVIIAPEAGGRAFVFEARAHHTSAFSSVGALRDDVAIQPPPSKTDRIAGYTHTFPAGMFNRPYSVSRSKGDGTGVTLTYVAPDVVPSGARFEKILRLRGDVLDVRERLVPKEGVGQRLVVLSSLAIGETAATSWRPPLLLPAETPLASKTTIALSNDRPVGLYDPVTHEFAAVRWMPGAVEKADLIVEDRHAVLRLRYAPGWHSTCYEYAYVTGKAAARARLLGRSLEGGRIGGVAERSTQSPQKRPGESPCGFKSHLPHQ